MYIDLDAGIASYRAIVTYPFEAFGFNQINYATETCTMMQSRLRRVHFQATFLLKITILSLHEAQAPNCLFSINFLVENDHSEPPRGAGSEWPIFKQLSD